MEVGQSKSGRILELFVEPSSRSRGVGAVLMREIEEYFMSLGCDTVKVEVFAPNAGALRFYRRLGYADWIVDLFKEIGLNRAENQTRDAAAKK